MKSFKQVMEKVYTSDYVLNKDGRKVHRKELVDKELDEAGNVGDSLGYLTPAERAKEIARRKAKIASNTTPASKAFVDKALKKEEVELEENHLMDYRRYTQAAKNAHAKGDHDIAKDAETKAKKASDNYTRVTGKKPTFNEELDEESTEYEKSAENKRSADAAKKQGDMFAHHLHMSDHHENLARWHASRGRHGEADKHSEKADAHHEKAMGLKEQQKGDSMLGFKDLVEKMNLAKVKMGDVIKDFQKSDAPQFAGKSEEKKRQMAIAAKLEADRAVKEELKGNQHKIDKNKNGKVDAHDFKLLRKEEDEMEEKFDPLKHVKNPTAGEKKAAKDVKRSSYADRAAMLKSAQADGRLKEEEMEEQAPVAPSLGVHRVSVTTSEPDHPMVSKRKETTQRFVKVTTNSKERALEQGMKHFKKKGFKVHSADHAGMVHEEVEQIEEANHREFAQAGKMHPDMAKHMKTGQEIDFYHSKTGDKISGKVTKNDGKAIHIQANKGDKVGGGETHKFAVSKNLGGQMHEGVDMPMTYKEFMEAMWPGTPEYKKKFADKERTTGAGARHDIVDTGKGVRATRRFNDNDTAEAPKTQEKRGRGRPAGSKSGANQKVTTKSDESGGMATHSLRLPSR